MDAAAYVRDLSRAYDTIHTTKEDAFWAAYMGLTGDAAAARATLDEAEKRYKAFVQDPDRLRRTRAALEAAGDAPEDVRTALEGWVRTLSANVIESPEARALAAEIIERESGVEQARGKMRLGYRAPGSDFVEASSVKLAVMLSTDRDETRRRAAWEGLRSIETTVLKSGFPEVVRLRNRLGTSLGGEDYYDWKVRRSEGMSKREIFDLLDDLEARTRDRARESLEELKASKGAGAVRPWNLSFSISGDTTTEQDPYFPFSRAFERWGRSFAALGIDYRGATMVLDLVDRKGKFENGFMHGPECAWRDDGVFKRARIHFTANAIPGMVGSGKRATETFFHEGGHAAHFANIDMPAPCFAQEFAPTSVAFAETQSMFLDSLLDDADWQKRYARTSAGDPIPFDLVEKGIRATQPYAAWMLRASFTVCYAERAIYELPEDELTPERILETVRDVERRMLFVEGSHRPVLSVPHLLSGEASACYHAYILALMAVHQTRRFFDGRDGHLVDNPRIGPDLARAYWQPGNSKRFPEFIRALTGEEVSAVALAENVTRDAENAVAKARGKVERLDSIPAFDGAVELGADIRIVHGHEEVAATAGGFDAAANAFRTWIESQQG